MRDLIDRLMKEVEYENAVIELGLELHAILPSWMKVLVRYPSCLPAHRLVVAAIHTIEDLLDA